MLQYLEVVSCDVAAPRGLFQVMLQHLVVVACDVAAPRGCCVRCCSTSWLFQVMLQHLVVVVSDVAVPRGLTSNVRCYWCSREHTGGRSSTVPITTVPIATTHGLQ